MKQGGKRLNNVNQIPPKVTIVCVTFNAASTLLRLFKSIAQYKTDDTELVIIDGNSTDETLALVKANDDLVDFWIAEPDEGIYDAMNKSISFLKGKWVIFIGADDELADGFAAMVSSLKQPDTVYYGNVIYYGREFKKVYDDYYLTKLNFCHQGIFYPKAVFDKYSYDTKYKVYADYHLNLRLWHDHAFKFIHKGHLVASFPEGGFSSTVKDIVFDAERDMLFKRYLKAASYYRYLNRTIGAFGILKRFLLNM